MHLLLLLFFLFYLWQCKYLNLFKAHSNASSQYVKIFNMCALAYIEENVSRWIRSYLHFSLFYNSVVAQCGIIAYNYKLTLVSRKASIHSIECIHFTHTWSQTKFKRGHSPYSSFNLFNNWPCVTLRAISKTNMLTWIMFRVLLFWIIWTEFSFPPKMAANPNHG